MKYDYGKLEQYCVLREHPPALELSARDSLNVCVLRLNASDGLIFKFPRFRDLSEVIEFQ